MKKKLLISVIFLAFVLFSFLSLNAQWARTYGGIDDDVACSIQQTSDGGYIVAGYTYSFGAGERDILVLKLSSTGAIEWQRTYGGSSGDVAWSIQQTSDGGYIVAGYTYSFGAGGTDILVLKLSSTGAIEWQRTYGGSSGDAPYSPYSIQQTSDGGYIVAGYTQSFGAGGADGWILKLSSVGDVEWQRTYGGSSIDVTYSIQQTSDGGYIVGGYTHSFGAGGADGWILKLSSVGDVEWQRTYGGIDEDLAAYPIQQTSDGGYIFAGDTYSFGAGGKDIWVLKLSSTGAIEWQRTYGGSDYDDTWSIQQTSDGGYIFAGRTLSFGSGSYDFCVIKLHSDGSIDPPCEGFIGSSDASIQDTSISPQDTSISPQNTSIFPLDTSISPQDSDAFVTTICGVPLYTLTISTGSGGTTNPAPDSYTYYSGTEVSITAIANSGYGFTGWSGDASGTTNPITITMDEDRSIEANFIRQYTLTIASGSGGTTDPSSGTYTHDSGTEVSITATPDSGYEFSGWSGAASGTTNPVTITMDSDKSITASFTATSTGGDDGGDTEGEGKIKCFIATAAYDSALHPHVEVLRDFKDKYLMPNKPGRMLVYIYYKYSPFIAELIAKNKVLKVAVRINLLPLVAFSYSMVHFGPIITSVILVFIFMLPLFLISFLRKRITKRLKNYDS